MSFPISRNDVLPAASRALENQAGRLRSWKKRADKKDASKINERAAELHDIAQLMDYITLLESSRPHNDHPIVVSETAHEAYERGFASAKRQYEGHSQHGIIDRRRRKYDNFGSPYNPANEAKRREHNARQAEKWADHY